MGPDWEQAVGKFILALGSIEHTTILFLGTLPDCNLGKSASKIPFGLRIEIIKEALSRHSEEVFADSLRAIKVAESLVPPRNLVAHNAVNISVYSDGDRLMLTSHLESSRDKTKRLSLLQTQQLAERAHAAALELSGAWMDLALYFDPDLADPNR